MIENLSDRQPLTPLKDPWMRLQSLLNQAERLNDEQYSHALDLALMALSTGDFQQRWDIAKLVPKLGTRAIAPLIEVLEDEEADWELRWFVSRILGEFREPIVLEVLVNLLKTSHSEDLIAAAATALTNFGSSAIAALSELLSDSRTRSVAVRSLCLIGGSQTVPPLLSVVGDRDPAICAMALEALSNSTDPSIIPVLIQSLKHPAAPVRHAATIGLGMRSHLLAEPDRVLLLKEQLWDLNFEVCQAAAIALGRLGTPEAAIALSHLLQSPSTPIPLQLEAVRALGWIGTPIALEQLQNAISHVPSTVIREIIMVIGRLENPATLSQATQILSELLQNRSVAESTSTKQSLAMSLGQLGQRQAIEPLVQLLADRDKSVQLHAIAALRQLKAYSDLEQLTHCQLSPELAQGVSVALQEWK